MKREEKINLAIAKCFGKSHLTEEDVSTIKQLSTLELIEDHGLNANQARNVILWCQSECQRKWGQDFQFPVDDLEDYEHVNPFSVHKHRGFRG